MLDTIRGSVIEIIDGDTFSIRVTHVGNENKLKYNTTEIIRISGIDDPELDTLPGQRSRDLLQRKLEGKEVRCYVQAKDSLGRVVANVMIL